MNRPTGRIFGELIRVNYSLIARSFYVGHGTLCCTGATLYVTVVTCHDHFFKVKFAYFHIKIGLLIFRHTLEFGQESRIFLATRSVLWPKTCRKCDSGRGSAPDPAGVAHDAPPNRLVGWGGDTPPHTRPTRRLRRVDRRAPLTPNPGDATGHHHFPR